MNYNPPDGVPFQYNRLNPPLFFAVTHDWKHHINKTTREYLKLYRNSRNQNFEDTCVLSSGITAGEFAMWFIYNNHNKRLK